LYIDGITKGIEDRRVSEVPAIFDAGTDSVIAGKFPSKTWTEQSTRYREYWRWFTGQALAEISGTTEDGEPIYRFPLQMNPIRNFSRKHAAVLLGEGIDGRGAFVRAVVEPSLPFNEEPPSDEDKKTAQVLTNIINEVWDSSDGRALQMENAILSQFLGGCVFQVEYVPEREDLVIPLRIKNVIPDFFLPVWNNDDPWDLLEAYVIYRIPAAAAKVQYGVVIDGDMPYATYLEHWSKKSYSIYINGQPVKSVYHRGKISAEVVFKDVENPFGFVPFVYIPHLREGGFYGSSMVDDIKGLVLELNSSYADLGDSVKETIRRRRYVSNVHGGPRMRQVGEGNWFVDLGITPASSRHEPKITIEDPPTLSPGMASYPDKVWEALLREANLADVFFGKDEGSQRSALTLAFRMLPTTSHIRAERSFWESGLEKVGRMILKACSAQPEIKRRLSKLGISIPADFMHRFVITQDWPPMIPRDREQEVNEIILRNSAGLISPQLAMQKFGDVSNIDDEMKNITEWKKSLYELDNQGAEAKTDVEEPVASTGTQE
jgi:hypothetical protein